MESLMIDDYAIHVGWEDVNNYLNSVAAALDSHQYSGVYGVPRGGLVIASWLAHKMYLPLLFAPSPNCIIIDDICDSGETLLHYVKNTSNPEADNNYYTTTMFFRKGNNYDIEPSYWYKEKKDKWIVFPWEE